MIKEEAVLTSRHFDPDFTPVYGCILDKWPETEDGCVWITAGYEERPGFHEKFRAIDVRTKNIRDWPKDPISRKLELQKLGTRCRKRLGRDWDVVVHLELAGTSNEHVHFELDQEG